MVWARRIGITCLTLLAGGDRASAQSGLDPTRLADDLSADSWRQRNLAARRLLALESPSTATVERVLQLLEPPESEQWGEFPVLEMESYFESAIAGSVPHRIVSHEVHDQLWQNLSHYVGAREFVPPPHVPRILYGRALRTAADLRVPLPPEQLAVLVLERWNTEARIDPQLRARVHDAIAAPYGANTSAEIQAASTWWRSDPGAPGRVLTLLGMAEEIAEEPAEVPSDTRVLVAAVALSGPVGRRWLADWALEREGPSPTATFVVWTVDAHCDTVAERDKLRTAVCDALLEGRFGPSTAAWIPDRRVNEFAAATARACLDETATSLREHRLAVLETRLRPNITDRRGQLRLTTETARLLAAAARATGEPILIRCLWTGADAREDAVRVATVLADLAGGLESLRAGRRDAGDWNGPRLRTRLPGYRDTGDSTRLTYEALFATGRVWHGLDSTAALPESSVFLLQHALCSPATLERYAAALAVTDLGPRAFALEPYCSADVAAADRLGTLAARLAQARARIAHSAESRTRRLAAFPFREPWQVRQRELDQCIALERVYSDPLPADLSAKLVDELAGAHPPYSRWLVARISPTRIHLPVVWPRIDWSAPPASASDWIALVDDPDLLAEHVVLDGRKPPAQRTPPEVTSAVFARLRRLASDAGGGRLTTTTDLRDALRQVARDAHSLEVRSHAYDLLVRLATPAEFEGLLELGDDLLDAVGARPRTWSPTTDDRLHRVGRAVLQVVADRR